MLKALNRFIFTVFTLAVFSISAHASKCENEDGLKLLETAQLNYPRRAEARGIEGYVKFRFTISTQGIVEDIVVIESEPKGIFDRSAVRSISKYKFTPCMVDGAPIEVSNVEQVFNFSLGR